MTQSAMFRLLPTALLLHLPTALASLPQYQSSNSNATSLLASNTTAEAAKLMRKITKTFVHDATVQDDERQLGSDRSYHYPGDDSGSAIEQRRRRRSEGEDKRNKQSRAQVGARVKSETKHKEREHKVFRYAKQALHDAGAVTRPSLDHNSGHAVVTHPSHHGYGAGPHGHGAHHHGNHNAQYYYPPLPQANYGHRVQYATHMHGSGKHKRKFKHKGHMHGFGKHKGKHNYGYMHNHMHLTGNPIIWHHPQAEKNHGKPTARDHFNKIMGYTPSNSQPKPTKKDGKAIEEEELREDDGYYYDGDEEWYGDKKVDPMVDPYYIPPKKEKVNRIDPRKLRKEAAFGLDKDLAAQGDPVKLKWLAGEVKKKQEGRTKKEMTGQKPTRS